MNWKEELEKRIEACGQAVIDHAEDIAGECKTMTYLSIGIDLGEWGKPPEININRSFVPESYFDKKHTDEDELKELLDQYILQRRRNNGKG